MKLKIYGFVSTFLSIIAFMWRKNLSGLDIFLHLVGSH